CAPLNGVMIGEVAPGSQPSVNGTFGLLNHRPRWNWWVGANVVVPPGETENVSLLKMPRTVAEPVPARPAFTSVWYHETPNGLFGSWITNRSKPVFGRTPWIETVIVSLSEPLTMVTLPPAPGMQALMPGDG